MHELLTETDIEKQFKPIYYLSIPLSYVNDISLVYLDNTRRRLTANQIANKFQCHTGNISLSKIYEDENIQQTEVNINFKKIANEINNAIVQMHNQHAKHKKGDS